MAKTVVLFSRNQAECSATERRSSFDSTTVPFTDRDITQDESALAGLEKLGVLTTPVVVIDEQTVIGYDVKRLIELLGLPTR